MKMQRFIIAAIITVLLLPISRALAEAPAGTNSKVTLSPNSKVITVNKDNKSQQLKLDVAPYNPDGVTLIPVRGVLDQLGANLQWIPAKRQVAINGENNQIILTLDSNTALVNNVPVTMDRAARSIHNRTMIPLRFLSENMGYYVKWYATENKIEIIKQTVAIVNGQAISRADYEKNSCLYKYFLEKQYGQTVWEQKDQNGVSVINSFPEMVMTSMINEEILNQKAIAEKTAVSDSDMNTRLQNYQNLIKGDPALAEQAKSSGVNDTFLKQKVSKELMANNYKTKYMSSLNITDQQLKTIYEQNIKSFQQEQVKASHILIKTVTEKTAQDKEANEKAYQKASELLKSVQLGEDFASLAKQYSEDPGSAPQGGDLGYFARGAMVKEFEEAAFGLEKGKISPLVKTSYGYHIIKVVDHKTETAAFEQVSGSIKEGLQKQGLEDHLNQIIQAAKTEKYGVN